MYTFICSKQLNVKRIKSNSPCNERPFSFLKFKRKIVCPSPPVLLVLLLQRLMPSITKGIHWKESWGISQQTIHHFLYECLVPLFPLFNLLFSWISFSKDLNNRLNNNRELHSMFMSWKQRKSSYLLICVSNRTQDSLCLTLSPILWWMVTRDIPVQSWEKRKACKGFSVHETGLITQYIFPFVTQIKQQTIIACFIIVCCPLLLSNNKSGFFFSVVSQSAWKQKSSQFPFPELVSGRCLTPVDI